MEAGLTATLVGPTAVGVVTLAPQPELALVELHCPLHVRDRDRCADPGVTETHDSPSGCAVPRLVGAFHHVGRYRSAQGRARRECHRKDQWQPRKLRAFPPQVTCEAHARAGFRAPPGVLAGGRPRPPRTSVTLAGSRGRLCNPTPTCMAWRGFRWQR